MHLCTLHPSLSALALNLELENRLSLAAYDSALAIKLNLNNKIQAEQPAFFAPTETQNGAFNYNDLSHEQVQEIISALDPASILYTSDYFYKFKDQSLKNQLLDACMQHSEPLANDLTQVFSIWNDIGKEFGKSARARDLNQRAEAQLMDWTSNFYSRLRGKKVIVVSQFQTLVLASSWINDLIRRVGAIAPEIDAEADQVVTDWDFIAKFEPHIIIFAPVGKDLRQSAQLFFELEKLDSKKAAILSETPAHKRGDIYFCSGLSCFYSLDYRIIDTAGILVSSIAGLDTGYITERDSFYKLRHLELHRHKFQP